MGNSNRLNSAESKTFETSEISLEVKRGSHAADGLVWSVDANGRKTGEIEDCFPQMTYLEELGYAT